MIGGMMKIIRDLEGDKVWQTKVSGVMWVYGKRVLVYARPPNAPHASIFGDFSFGIVVWANGLHMTSF